MIIGRVIYRMEIQLLAGYELSDDMMDRIADMIPLEGSYEEDITSTYSATMTFESDDMPSDIKEEFLRELFKTFPGIYYVDVEYIYAGEFTPDRFVMWNDGRCVEYTGRVVYEEDAQ